MMTNKSLYFFAIIFFVALAAGVAVWLFNATPGYSERERYVRAETAALERDITEIETMDGGVPELEKKLENVKIKITNRYSGRSDRAQGAEERVNEICEKAGLKDAEINMGRSKQISPAGDYTPALFTSEVTILFTGDDRKGFEIVRGLENISTADFEVMGFVCRLTQPDRAETGEETEEGLEDETEAGLTVVQAAPVGEWLITALIYYYE